MGYGYSVEAVLRRLGQPTGDIARFCFEGAVERIRGTDAHRLLMALSLFATDASRQALGYVAELGEDIRSRDEGLVALERLSLVNKRGDRFAMLPLTTEYARAERFGEPDKGGSLETRWINYFRQFTKEFGNGYWRWYNYELLVSEGKNILAALDWAYSSGEAQIALDLMPAVYWYLDVVGRWNDMLKYGQRALDLVNSVGDRASAVGLMSMFGWTLGQMGEFSEAKEFLQRGLSACESIGGNERHVAKCNMLAHLGQVARKARDFAKARTLYGEASKIVKTHNLTDEHQANIDYELGKLARDQGDWELAREFFFKVYDWAKEKQEDHQILDTALAMGAQGNLALALYHQSAYGEARDLCIDSIRFFEKQGGKGYLAVLKHRYALIEEALGNHEAALRAAREGLQMCCRLGMRPEIETMEALVRRLEEDLI